MALFPWQNRDLINNPTKGDKRCNRFFPILLANKFETKVYSKETVKNKILNCNLKSL